MLMPLDSSNRETDAMKASRSPLLIQLLLIALMAVLVLGCDEELQERDTGGIYLSVEFVNFPIRVGVDDQTSLAIPNLAINSIEVNQSASTSDLMDVQLSTMEVTFSRADTGTRVPVPYVVQLLGTVPVGGALSYSNLPIMGIEQMRAKPLSDLQFENGGIDEETGNEYIRLNVIVRVFGRTLGGESVASDPRGHTIEFVPSLLTAQ